MIRTMKFLSLILILFCTLSCTNKNEVKLGFLYTSETMYRFFKEGEFFEERAKQLGAEVIVKHGDNNDALQYQIAMEMIDEGIDVLVLVAVNNNTANAIVRDAKDKGVMVIANNRMIPNSELDWFVAGTNKQLGVDLATFAIKNKPSGNYILFGGDRFDKNAEEIQAAMDSILAPQIKSGQINILYRTFIENWDGDNAAFELNQIISSLPEKPDVLLTSNDGMAEGAIKVLEQYGLAGKVLVTGQDCQLQTCKNIIAGKHNISLYHPLKEIGYKTAELAVDMARGENLKKHKTSMTNNGLKEVPTLNINSIPVTIENIDKVLIEGGAYTREQIYE